MNPKAFSPTDLYFHTCKIQQISIGIQGRLIREGVSEVLYSRSMESEFLSSNIMIGSVIFVIINQQSTDKKS